jgi:hypothetical protein
MSQFNIQLSDQNRVKVTQSLKSFNTINSLLNVDVTGLSNGNILVYNSTTGKWTATSNITGLNIDAGTFTTPLTTIRIKRSGISSTPTVQYGELAVSVNSGLWNDNGGRLWVGNGSGVPVVIGGKYFADLADHQPGVLTPSSAIIVDQNSNIDTLNITGRVSIGGSLSISGNIYSTSLDVASIGISSNIISTKVGSGNVLYIDPYPSGFSNQGTVIIKGNLQVDGTTTSVDSTTITINSPIISLGNVVSNRTVIGNVSAGSTTITLDSIVGINTGDVITYSLGLPANENLRTVTYYNSSVNTIQIAGTISGLSSSTQLIITHAWDTQTNRGVSFNYNDDSVGLGTSATKTGFFGYQDYNKRFTFVPDATIGVTTSTGLYGYVSGTKGYLDIKGLYYQPADISQYGVVYFDSSGLMNSTVAPGSGTTTSNYILTTVTGTDVPVWTNRIDGGTF